MYDRNIAGKVLDFEASGSLYHSALVMQDDQTNTLWAIINALAIGGELQDSKLSELPISEKLTWSEWLKKHPNTKVLQVNGKTHLPSNPYDKYFNSDKTFGDVLDLDTRLPAKAPIFVFELNKKAFAVPHTSLLQGWTDKVAGKRILIARNKNDSIYRSSRAWLLEAQGKELKLKKNGNDWVSAQWGRLNLDEGRFEKGDIKLQRLAGFDTFWYIWSQFNKKGKLLAHKKK